jgi:hypothetical protein
MSKLDDITLGDVTRGLRRYQPFIGVVAAILLIAVFLPGNAGSGGSEETAGGQAFKVGEGGGRDGNGDSVSGAGDESGSFDSGGGGDLDSGGGGGTDGSGDATGGGGPGGTDEPLVVPADAGPNCDTATGRIRVPSRFAPPCVPHMRDNGGTTWGGVTGDTITVVYYQPEADPATEAALRAAGAANSQDEQQKTVEDFVGYFNAHYELQNRQVKLVTVRGTGESDDDKAGAADGLKVATDIKPFAVVSGAPNNAFVDQMVAHKTLCICTTSQPQEFYEERSPYVGYWGLMASTQGYIHRAEYIGKRIAGKAAKWAGTSDGLSMASKKRVFGLLYYETADKAYAAGVAFFKRELAKYNVTLKESLAYTGPPDLATTQEQARPYIQRLKRGGVTSVVFSGDPISPAIFTQEATRQLYFPEWIITGSALTDTTIFGRTYDSQQWRRAFGISFLNARFPDEQAESYAVHMWHYGRPPTADNQHAVLYAPLFALFTGMHMAGPTLNPNTFQQGLFNYPVTGRGMITSAVSSWGKHGIWPFTDYTQLDDVTEIWWDPNAQGEDEVGNNAVGMYRYVDGGKRYMPGGHPRTEPKAFVPAGSVTMYNERPAQDRPPQYPHQHFN